jgi:hypothetical protein
MCFQKDKWTKFTPTNKYLSAIKDLTSVARLYSFIQQFKRKEDKKDYWQTPGETLILLTYDCDDSMRFTVDVLKRVMGIEAKGVIQSGYNYERWGKVKHHHAITVFPYRGKLAVFSNKKLYIGINSFEEAGYLTFPDGLKYQEIRDSEGKILSRKHKWIGTF